MEGRYRELALKFLPDNLIGESPPFTQPMKGCDISTMMRTRGADKFFKRNINSLPSGDRPRLLLIHGNVIKVIGQRLRTDF
jgi:hypothetical protein